MVKKHSFYGGWACLKGWRVWSSCSRTDWELGRRAADWESESERVLAGWWRSRFIILTCNQSLFWDFLLNAEVRLWSAWHDFSCLYWLYALFIYFLHLLFFVDVLWQPFSFFPTLSIIFWNRTSWSCEHGRSFWFIYFPITLTCLTICDKSLKRLPQPVARN